MMMFMDMDAMLGSDFEKTLAGLKAHCESLPSQTAAAYVSEMASLPVMKLMTLKDSASLEELSGKFGMMYQEINAEIAKQGLAQAGPVLAIYDKVDHRADGSMYFWFHAGIPVDKAGKSTERIEYMESTGSTAVKCDYHGGYGDMKACHDAINKYITDNGKTINGPVWEVYVTDPGAEPDSTRWLTQIYYPVQ
jgi:effector-binding domain-containing protein